jgi:HAD superfamily hydrolase (TIGR01509 family)
MTVQLDMTEKMINQLFTQAAVKAILFDNDGVLVDSERMFFESTQRAFAAAGTLLTLQQWANWYLAEGKSSKEIARLLGMSSTLIDNLIQRRNEQFWSQVARGVPILPGVPDLLKRLAGNYRLAVVTGASRKHFDWVHVSTGLPPYFEQIITSDDYESVKPSPDAYLTALERLGLAPEECLAVEDSPRGAKSARSAGIPCVIIPTDLTDRALCPSECLVLESMNHLLEKVTQRMNS